MVYNLLTKDPRCVKQGSGDPVASRKGKALSRRSDLMIKQRLSRKLAWGAWLPHLPSSSIQGIGPKLVFLTPPHSESLYWTLKKFRQGEGLFGLKVQGRHHERFGGGQWAECAWRQER